MKPMLTTYSSFAGPAASSKTQDLRLKEKPLARGSRLFLLGCPIFPLRDKGLLIVNKGTTFMLHTATVTVTGSTYLPESFTHHDHDSEQESFVLVFIIIAKSSSPVTGTDH
jgi:hypothetical protein